MNTPLFIWLGILAVKVALCVGLGFFMALVFRKASAANRYILWLAVILSLGLLPFFMSYLPTWQLAAAMPRMQTNATDGPLPLITPSSLTPAYRLSTRIENVAARSRDWSTVILGAIFAGVGAQGFLGLVRLAQTVRYRKKADILPWEQTPLGVSEARRPALYLSDEVRVPMLCGWWRPFILLPTAALSWPAEVQRAALEHELAHYRRRDHLTMPLLLIVRVAYWWHPGVWLALRELRRAREQACDDLVITSKIKPSAYAASLLHVAKSLAGATSYGTLAMASSAKVGRRIEAVLDERKRRNEVGQLRWASFAFFVLFAAGAGAFASTEEAKPLTKSSSEPPPAPGAPGIEVGFKMMEIEGDAFAENRSRFEEALKITDEKKFGEFLRFLNKNPKGIDLMSSPQVTTKSDQKATVLVTQEFKYPTAYDNNGKPTRFDSKDLGMELEVSPVIRGNKASVSGKITITDFVGFVGNDKGAPKFDSQEVHFARQMDLPAIVGMDGPQRTDEIKASDGKIQTVTRHLLIFLSASLVPPQKRLSQEESEKYLLSSLATTQVKAMNYDQTPLENVLGGLLGHLNNQRNVQITWTLAPDEQTMGKQLISLHTDGGSTIAVLNAIKKLTGYDYQVEGGLLIVGPPDVLRARKAEREQAKDLAYGIPVADKPGYVLSPYAPNGKEIFVAGYPAGSLFECPYTKKKFLIP